MKEKRYAERERERERAKIDIDRVDEAERGALKWLSRLYNIHRVDQYIGSHISSTLSDWR
jgi:hypothetical protein